MAASDHDRVVVVPESVNPGWVAHSADGTALRPITVNGWQQGWVVPAGTDGTLALTFPANLTYRIGLFGGLALLPVLALLALLPIRRRITGEPVQPWMPAPWLTGAAVLAAGALISGVTGIVVVAAAIGVRYLLCGRAWSERITVGVTAGGLIAAGAVLSRGPWRSVDGYLGHSAGVQFLALLSVAMLAASTVDLRRPGTRTPSGGEETDDQPAS